MIFVSGAIISSAGFSPNSGINLCAIMHGISLGFFPSLSIPAIVTSLGEFSFCIIIIHPQYNLIMDEVNFRFFYSILNRINSLYNVAIRFFIPIITILWKFSFINDYSFSCPSRERVKAYRLI